MPNTAHTLPFMLCDLWSRDIQCNYSSAYSGFNIQLNVSALLLDISRQFNARYAEHLEPNIEHIVQFTLSELRSRTYRMYLQLRIFRHEYSSARICAATGDISTIQCALYWKLGAKYSAHPPVYATCAVVLDIHNVITVTYIQASIFKWANLRCYWRYPDISTSVVMQIGCQI
jgi:hypothetical protein